MLIRYVNGFKYQLEMCPLEHEWPATYKVEAPLLVGFLEISGTDIYRGPYRMSGVYTIIL